MDLLIDEVYTQDNGGFMGFFQSNKVKKIGSRLDTGGASNVLSSANNGRNSVEGELAYGSQSTFRNIDYHR
jgi:hypothetical protein